MRCPSPSSFLFALVLAVTVAGCTGLLTAKPAPVTAAAPTGSAPPAIPAVRDEASQARAKEAAHGPDSETPITLLDTAVGLATGGELGKAIRIAKRANEPARLGLQQAAENAHAGPCYPN